ncbi:ATP-dependent RecD-like DNA helicase [Lactobacillus sp. YT155]|uniref:SF1B family DNA helicase RecD2 n=1 Tax=Lactobacillus sp. YT155 TaxID=3060955 RepID=UPI00265E6D4B|nr:ATP-dependent RecD-like DNA helicase [Lactobacillus sp. YT155]MDO1605286.1 ATP-dependent RecD-like DNA helicase [Lactobacillus sp. YT155]
MDISEDQNYIVGTVEAIFFENPDNFFKIILVAVDETNTSWNEPEIVVTGYFGDLTEERDYEFVGELVNHPKYGQQFKSESYSQKKLTDKKSIVNYFSSDLFSGIGKKTAEKIVEVLGNDPIETILRDKSSLDKLKLSNDKKEMIYEQVQANHEVEQILLELNKLGIGNTIATKIYQTYHSQTLETVMNNPYKLVEDINGIGFKKADSIAEELGFEVDNDFRIRGAILHVLNLLSSIEGNTYADETVLKEQTQKLLMSSRFTENVEEKIATQVKQLVTDGYIVKEEQRLYLKYLYDSEWSIASGLKLLADSYEQELDEDELEQAVQKSAKQLKISYDDSQIEAIKMALKNPVFLLTGGPGTGKTTIINGIVATFAKLHKETLNIADYKNNDFPVALAAPTGRAAKQMTDTTGLPASTIHRLLGLNGSDDINETTVSEITADLIIIDEMSMVDVSLFKQLLSAINPGSQLILVGDKDQLPSVGPGQVFSDMIESEALPTKKLDFIYRQDSDSSITKLAHDVNEGIIDDELFRNFSDRSFIECNDRQVPEAMEQIINRVKERDFDIDDVQVLAPMYKGNAGIDNLNNIIQNILNPLTPNKKTVKFGNIDYRIGDKVAHLVNNPENNIFNGEIGVITGITYAKDSEDNNDELHLNFSGQEIMYPRSDWSKITLAYCTSIHKAQGSEFELVIMPLVRQSRRMLKRNLLYTGITRAKSMLIMMGDKQAYIDAIKDVSSKRATTLINRMRDTFKIEKATTVVDTTDLNYELTNDIILSNDVDPMIGMENISPYDFVKQE